MPFTMFSGGILINRNMEKRKRFMTTFGTIDISYNVNTGKGRDL